MGVEQMAGGGEAQPPERPRASPRHEVHRFLSRLHAALDAVDSQRVWSLSLGELGECLERAYSAQARLAELTLSLLAQADDVDLATHDAEPATVAWLRDRVRLAPAEARRQLVLARAVTAHPVTRQALAAGAFPPASAEVITTAVDGLAGP